MSETDLDVESLEQEGYVSVCDVDDVPDMRPKKVEIDDHSILICRGEDGLFAVDEICPHEDKSMRFGVVQWNKIVCPHHQYRFDLDTGKCRRRRCEPVPVYDLEIVDGTVYVRPGA
jgi:nitrite reductase/ring-hydroxylating ferredoxin subunit